MYFLRSAAVLLVASGLDNAPIATSAQNFNYEVIRSETTLSSTPKNIPVTFSATFTNLWTKDSHPYGFPSNSAHWSPMVFASHSYGYYMWCHGCTATSGVESIAELGNTSGLRGEIGAKQQGVDYVLDQKMAPGMGTPVGLRDGTSSDGNLCVDQDHALVSAISMIAPSPDWFSGFYDLRLWKRNMWYKKVQAYINAWDAGTEEGMSYSLSNPDTSPHEGMTPFVAGNNKNKVFVSEEPNNGNLKVLPVGIITFELKGSTPECTSMSSASNPSPADTTRSFYVRIRMNGVQQLTDPISCNELTNFQNNGICRKKTRDAFGNRSLPRVQDLCPITCENV